mgnify:CR=1 FL=1
MRENLDAVYLALEKRGYKIHEIDELDIEYALDLFCKEKEIKEKEHVMTPEELENFYNSI